MKKYYKYNNDHFIFYVMGVIFYTLFTFLLVVSIVKEELDNILSIVVSMIAVFPIIVIPIVLMKSHYVIVNDDVVKVYKWNKFKEEFKVNEIKEIYIFEVAVYRGSVANMSFVFENTNKLELDEIHYFNYLKRNNIKHFNYRFNKKILREIKPRKYNIKPNKPYHEV